ncbi:MAG: hypothetical protein GQ582_10335 [Methyloprofundus sp.]|nr:hypothetical protein [Methyloprofundus sp.]
MASIYGSVYHRDGSKANGTITVANSWNSSQVTPKNGRYSLDLGSNPKQKVTLYVDNMSYTEVHVFGSARVDIVAWCD